MQCLLKNRTEHKNLLYEEHFACFTSAQNHRARIRVILLSAALIVFAAWYGYDSNCFQKVLSCGGILALTVCIELVCFPDKIFALSNMRQYKKWGSKYSEAYFYETYFDLCNQGSFGKIHVYYADVEEFAQSEHYFFIVTYDNVAHAVEKDGFEGITPQAAERFLRERIPVR